MPFVSYMFRFAAALYVTFRILFAVGNAYGQSHFGYESNHIKTGHLHAVPVGFGYGHYHASTAAEGFLRGKAAVIEAVGNFEVLDAQARILNEQARTLDRENDLNQTKALQAQKKLWSDARVQERKDREARGADGRKLLAERRATSYRQAYELSANELDLITGKISWSGVLLESRFDKSRARIEELFRQHVGYGVPRADVARQIERAIDQWSRTLRNEVDSMSKDEFLAAQKFLMGLKYGAASVIEAA